MSYIPQTEEERKFLENYKPGDYDRPSVTADIVALTLDNEYKLSVLLIKRGGYPYKGYWALPGGFVGINESVDSAAARELEEETGIKELTLNQIGTFGDVDRDPRMRVISVAYMAFVPMKKLAGHKAGDDAAESGIFRINGLETGFRCTEFLKEGIYGPIKDDPIKTLAFDHTNIIQTAVKRLQNRISYTDDAFSFLENDQRFTIYELRRVFEAVNGYKADPGNFSRMFKSRFLTFGTVEPTGEYTQEHSGKKAAVYRKVR